MLAAFLVWGAADAQRIMQDGFEESCLVDTDNDRLPNCEEVDRSLNYTNPDTDGDGLSDGDEVLGTLGGLDLPALGVDPRHKDMLVEMDWDDDDRICVGGPHSHRPAAEEIEGVRIFFATVPLSNPDGVPGINFIADYGQGGLFTGGNLVDFPNAVTTPLGPTFYDVKAANFATNRIGYFRYQAHAHYWADFDNSSGWGNIWGDNSIVTLNCAYGVPGFARNTIIHELGHNLSLQHGGSIFCNGLPNYNSLMNYRYQFKGLDVDCDRLPDGIDNVGYSSGTRNTLLQGQINEALGVCPPGHPQHKPIDWNGNGVIDQELVNYNGKLSTDLACANLTTSSDFNDYAALKLKPTSPPGGGAPTPTDDSGSCPSLPEM